MFNTETGNDLLRAKAFLESSEIVAIPTETVYGLAANALDVSAVVKVFQAKNRPSFDPLIVHTDKLEKVRSFVQALPPQASVLAEAFWPGPLTLLLPKKEIVPDIVTSGLPNVAVRIPDHPLTLSLLSMLSFPLAAPSANPFGYVSPTKAGHVMDQLQGKIPYILDGGESTVGIESTIIGFSGTDVIVYRLGGMSVEAIEKLVGKVTITLQSSSNPQAPGMLISHYAPRKQVVVGKISELIQQYNSEEIGILSFRESYYGINAEHQMTLSATGDMEEAARHLFASLRKMDNLPIKVIITELVPDHGLGRAINDRLRRASGK